MIPTYVGFTLARNSACSPKIASVKPYTSFTD
ncbi:hypothetical protein ABIB76_005088 [Bradyrhizobium sp. i1.12.3]